MRPENIENLYNRLIKEYNINNYPESLIEFVSNTLTTCKDRNIKKKVILGFNDSETIMLLLDLLCFLIKYNIRDSKDFNSVITKNLNLYDIREYNGAIESGGMSLNIKPRLYDHDTDKPNRKSNYSNKRQFDLKNSR